LEFSLLSDVGGEILGLSSILGKSILFFTSSIVVLYIVLKYGLRGFVFTDFFQTPIIFICTIFLVVGSLISIFGNVDISSVSITSLITPKLGAYSLILFSLHVIFLNSFLVLVTEPHWLRVWMFKEKETTLQLRSTLFTAVLWAILAALGFGASQISNAAQGPEAVKALVASTTDVSPVFSVAFWFAAIAALFSTSDTQVYSFLLFNRFDTSSGELRQEDISHIRPVRDSLIGAFALSTLFVFIRWVGIPFEKIIFLVIPFGLNVLPGIIHISRYRVPRPSYLLISLVGFTTCAIVGLLQPQEELFWTLAAALSPMVVSLVAWFYPR